MAEDKFVVRMGQRGGGKTYALELRLNKEIAENARLRDCIGQLEETLQVYHEAMQESVRHGEWLPVGEWYQCSECLGTTGKSNYCPNCGVRMVGE